MSCNPIVQTARDGTDRCDFGRIAAIVVTYNRLQRLRRWLDCIGLQDVPPDHVIVVDNGSRDGTPDAISVEYPDVELVAMEENLGPSAGMRVGMERAFMAGFDWLWVFDDDAFPAAHALRLALDTARRVDDARLGMVWLPFDDFGGWRWCGRKIPVSLREQIAAAEGPFRIDQVDLNMTLISRELVARVGYPRPDFFIMLWSCEFCLRVAEAGFHVWVAPQVAVVHEHAGSTGRGLWRSYYQTRNQLTMALEHRSVRELHWWFVRQIFFLAGTILRHDRKWQRIRLRLLGAWHALRGVMGKTVDPADYD